jgi:hypothetical protein
VIRSAKPDPEGAIAPTARGFAAKARKNSSALRVFIKMDHPSRQ